MGTPRVPIPEEAIREFCRRHRVVRMALFGSILRDDFTPASDVDVLVEFAPDARVGLFGLGEMECELAEIIGRKVDLNTRDSLSRHFRDAVLAQAETVYVAEDHDPPKPGARASLGGTASPPSVNAGWDSGRACKPAARHTATAATTRLRRTATLPGSARPRLSARARLWEGRRPRRP